MRSPATPQTARAVGDCSSAGASSLASENMMYPMETIETFAPAPPGTHPPLDSPGYRSTHLRHPNHDPLRLDPGKARPGRARRPAVRGGRRHRRRCRLDDRSRRRGSRPADHRHRAAARRRRATDRQLTRRALAGQRVGQVPPRQRPVAGNARPQLHRQRALPHRCGRHLSLHDDPSRRLPVGQPSQRLAPGPSALLLVRALVHPATGHPDVLPRRSAVLPGSDLQRGPRTVPPRR